MKRSPPRTFDNREMAFIVERFRMYAQTRAPGLGNSPDWDEIATELREESGLRDYAAEALRQNIVSKSKKKRQPPRAIRDPWRRYAVYEFLRRRDFIHPRELTEVGAHEPAAFALQHFLAAQRPVDPDPAWLTYLAGAYEIPFTTSHKPEYGNLVINRPTPGFIVKVIGVRLPDAFDDESVDIMQGWLVGNGRYVQLMLRQPDDTPLCYLVLQTAPSIDAKAPITDLALLRYTAVDSRALTVDAALLDERGETATVTYDMGDGLGDAVRFYHRKNVQFTRPADKGRRAHAPKRKQHFLAPAAHPAEKGGVGMEADAIDDLDQRFMRFVMEGHYDEAMALVEAVDDINVRDPDTGATALLICARRGVLHLLAKLEERADLDYLVQDNEGNVPFISAWFELGDDPLFWRLAEKAKAQALALPTDQRPWPFSRSKPPSAQPR